MKRKAELLNVSRKLAKLFQIRVEIRMFGKLVWSYTWPPSDGDESSEHVNQIIDNL